MTKRDLARLQDACSIKWAKVEIGGIEGLGDRKGAFRANHVYINCEMPMLVAAASVDLASGEEVFGLTLVQDTAAIDRFLSGPFHPHNAPQTLSLKQIGGEGVDAFMREYKKLDVSRKTWKGPKGSSLVTMVQGVSITSGRGRLCIHADDTVPMSLLVSWIDK